MEQQTQSDSEKCIMTEGCMVSTFHPVHEKVVHSTSGGVGVPEESTGTARPEM